MSWENTIKGDAHHEFETFDEILSFWAKQRPDAVALEQDDLRTTYGELDKATRQIVALYQANGIAPGDRVAWLGKNSEFYCKLYLAAARMGAVMVPIGWRLAVPEASYIVSDTGAKVIFVEPEFAKTARDVAADLPHRPDVLGVDDARKTIAAFEPNSNFTPPAADVPILQLYTSGTTGNPKGAVLSNRNLLGLRNAAAKEGLAWTFL